MTMISNETKDNNTSVFHRERKIKEAIIIVEAGAGRKNPGQIKTAMPTGKITRKAMQPITVNDMRGRVTGLLTKWDGPPTVAKPGMSNSVA